MSDVSPRGARRTAARRRFKDAVAGRIRIGVAIVAGGAFGALVVLWGGLGPDSDSRDETRSADEVQCEVQAGCVPSASVTPSPTPAPSVGVAPTRPRPPGTSPRAGRLSQPEPTAAAAGAENPATTPTPMRALTASTATPGELTPSASRGDPFDVVVGIPPIILPTCILDC